MRFLRRMGVVVLAPWLGLACSAGGEPPDAADAPPPISDVPAADADLARAIVEADIIQLDGGRLFAMSLSGTLSVVDVSQPAHLALLGQTTFAGRPFEMYRRGNYLLAMVNDAAGGSAAVSVLDVHDAKHLVPLGSLEVPGEIADSRLVGDVLYLATYENAGCHHCSSRPRTLVTSFDAADPTALKQVDQQVFQSNAPDGYNLPWGMHWKRSIVVTGERLYLGGHGDIAPESYDYDAPDEGIIDVLDITDPKGHLVRGARLVVAGAILSRWQIDEKDGVLRVVSQRGAGRTGNGIGMPRIDTYRVDSSQSFAPLGHASLSLPRQEGLRTVRFDGDRAYAITYNQTDPLFTIDLSNPAAPSQRGELFMPGFMYYLEPHGDRLVGLGIDRADPGGSLNVSLFDVKNLAKPRLLSRVPFGTPRVWEDYEILNAEVAEDQDRIQKAFRVLDDGLVAIPFSSLSDPSCANSGGGVQLVAWENDALQKRALLPLPGNPRRALEHGGELLALSDSHVRSFSLAPANFAQTTATLTIDVCTPRDRTGLVGRRSRYPYWVGCATSPGSKAPTGALLAIAALAVALVRGRRRSSNRSLGHVGRGLVPRRGSTQ